MAMLQTVGTVPACERARIHSLKKHIKVSLLLNLHHWAALMDHKMNTAKMHLSGQGSHFFSDTHPICLMTMMPSLKFWFGRGGQVFCQLFCIIYYCNLMRSINYYIKTPNHKLVHTAHPDAFVHHSESGITTTSVFIVKILLQIEASSLVGQ